MDDWESGEVELAVDDNADSLLPRPDGLIDESDLRGDYDPAAFDKSERTACRMNNA
jgi:hypothetical protein